MERLDRSYPNGRTAPFPSTKEPARKGPVRARVDRQLARPASVLQPFGRAGHLAPGGTGGTGATTAGKGGSATTGGTGGSTTGVTAPPSTRRRSFASKSLRRAMAALNFVAAWLSLKSFRCSRPPMSRTKSDPPSPSLELGPRLLSEPLAQARRQLLELEPGGSRSRPLEVASASVIEPKAESALCPRCNGHFEVATQEVHIDARLREAKVACRFCGEHRSLWFRINAPS
jgi:hypothetical protein